MTHPLPGTIAMLCADHLDAALIRSLTAEFSRRGTVHHAEAAGFTTYAGEVRAVRWALQMADSDDDYGTQLIDSLLEDAADRLDSSPVTSTVLPAQLRPRSTSEPMMLVMDVDSTLIDQEVIDLLAARAGRGTEVAEITERAMAGELDFTASLHARVRALSGLREQVLEDTRRDLSPTAGAAQLIAAFRSAGHPVCAVSGGFIQILQPLAEQLGLTAAAANELELAGGKLTGQVTGEVVDRSRKRRLMLQWAEEFGVDAHNVVAVGDGANDLDMVTSAGVGAAFCAKPALAEQADLVIRHRNLALIAFALGLPQASNAPQAPAAIR
ncbi:phosphoserine phosphatase SerB [Nesterenkonia sp.]|uniref:phosphoserine phosphatase SerB n=1 Tax=Nesterenkonia sp. TaxID=704201 RepID=UPI0026329CD3|nr:phosphoserine phosphatase SerB [Nesterenkonia sp.]